MYQNARVDGNPGGGDWKSKLPEALKNKVPEGADNFYKDGDVYIFTKDGAAISGGKYKADGSVFTASSSSSSNMPALDNNKITQGIMQQGGSIFNFGAGTGVDLNSSFVGGNYNVNTNKLMGAAGLLGVTSMLASEAPLGLGGLLGSLAMPGIMAGFMKSLSFNFDFSNMFTSSQAGSGTGTLPEGFEKTALPDVYKKDGKFYKKDDIGNWLQCDDTGKIKDEAKLPTGYEKTATEGIYKKGEVYIKYDAETRTYVACDANGNKKADAPAAEKPAADKPAADKPAADKPAAEKPAAKKPAADKPAAERPARQRIDMTGFSSYSNNKNLKNIKFDDVKNAQNAAQHVLEAMIKGYEGLDDTQKAKLKAEIIKHNPSVFASDGKLKAGVTSLGKLDVPSDDWIKTNISANYKAKTNVQSAEQTYASNNGYAAAKGYQHLYTKGNTSYAYISGQMLKVTRFMSDGSYQVGLTTYNKAGTAVSSVRYGREGVYTANGGKAAYTPSAGISYGGTHHNCIVKEEDANNSSTADKDAQWHINGGVYNLYIENGMIDRCLDFHDIKGTRTVSQNSGHSFVRYDGYLDPMAKMFDYGRKKVYFDGKGEFAGCAVKRIQDTGGTYRLCVEKNGSYYDLNVLMRTGEKTPVRPGTFISQGK